VTDGQGFVNKAKPATMPISNPLIAIEQLVGPHRGSALRNLIGAAKVE